MTTCESCGVARAEVTERAPYQERPYHLCRRCHGRLVSFSLRPREWCNLASIHGWWQYHLHDDFYDTDGTALQPDAEVIDAESFPCPTLEEVAGSPDDLLSHCITCWCPPPDVFEAVIAAVSAHPPEALLAAFASRLQVTREPGIVGLIFHLCGRCVGPPAADFVRERWDECSGLALGGLALAAARCLPFDEGFAKAEDALAALPERARTDNAYVLGWFRAPRALDWIERNVPEYVTEHWGRLAAVSRLDWPRAAEWLSRGRPLSLVALDALRSCVRRKTPMLEELPPRLADPPTADEFTRPLRSYAARDPAPRVVTTVSFLLDPEQRGQICIS